MLLTENWISVFPLVFCCSHWTLHNLWPVGTGQVFPILFAWFSLLGCPPATPLFPWRGKKLLNIWHTALAEALLVLSAAEGLLHAFNKLQFCVNTPVLTFNIFTTVRFCWLMLRLWFTPCRAPWICRPWIPTLHPALCRSSPHSSVSVECWHVAHFCSSFSFLEILAGWSQLLFFFPGVLSTHPSSLCWRHKGCPSSLTCCFSPHQQGFSWICFNSHPVSSRENSLWSA